MAACLLDHSLTGVHENNSQVSRRGTRHHVPCVLDVAWSISDDKLTLGSSEVAVGYINGNPLLTLGFEAVC